MLEIDTLGFGKEVNVAGWLPGNAWSETAFDPIYQKAARQDYDVAAMLFGLIVWVYFMERPDVWGLGHYDLEDRPIKSLTYFRLQEE